jgi:hypothetical protein
MWKCLKNFRTWRRPLKPLRMAGYKPAIWAEMTVRGLYGLQKERVAIRIRTERVSDGFKIEGEE